MCGRYFVQCGFIEVCIFYRFFWKTSFLVFLWAFCVFYLFCVEFDARFIVNFLTLHNRCLQNNRCQVLCVFVLTYLKQFVKTDTRYKNLSIALEAVVRRCSSKWIFLKILQIAQGTPVLESLFNKVAGQNICNFIKERFHPRGFLVKSAKLLRTSFFCSS